MTIRVYRSTDYGAPSLTQDAGSQIAVIKACLVNGYGSQTVTITRSGSTATITCTSAHGILGTAMYKIAGADQSEYNGEHQVTVVSTTQLSFTVSGTPATPATGTITGSMGSCTWTNPYSGTNVEVFRPAAGPQHYLRMSETNSSPDATTNGRIRAYESMTDATDSGTNPYPSDAQVSGGLYFYKGSATGTYGWCIVASESHFYMWRSYSTTAALSNAVCFGFGAFQSHVSGESYNSILMAGNATSTTANRALVTYTSALTNSGVTNHIVARNYAGTAGGVLSHLVSNYGESASLGDKPYPDTVSSAMTLGTLELLEDSENSTRGFVNGLYQWCHSTSPFADFDVFRGNGAYSSKWFIAFLTVTGYVLIMEISNTYTAE